MNPLRQRKYRELIRKHLDKLLGKLFAEFTGVHYHVAWAPASAAPGDAQTFPTARSIYCRLARTGLPPRAECRTCGPRHLTAALKLDRGHHFVCRRGLQNYWLPLRVCDEVLGIAYLQALEHSPRQLPLRKGSAHRTRRHPGPEDVRVMSHLKFSRAARFLRLIVHDWESSSLADLQRDDLDKVRQALRIFENVQSHLRKKLNGLLPAIRKTPPIAQTESHREQMVHVVLDRIHRDLARPLTLQ